MITIHRFLRTILFVLSVASLTACNARVKVEAPANDSTAINDSAALNASDAVVTDGETKNILLDSSRFSPSDL